MEACDDLDGLKDGVIGRPDQCTIDPAVLQCSSGYGPDCLSAGQVDTERKIYAGPVHAITGEQIYPGLLRGGESGIPDRHAIADHRLRELPVQSRPPPAAHIADPRDCVPLPTTRLVCIPDPTSVLSRADTMVNAPSRPGASYELQV